MKLQPLGNRVILKAVEAEEKTSSGIILPGGTKEKPQEAVVIALNQAAGDFSQGETVKEGDRVIYSQYAGTTVKVDEEEYIIVEQKDILAIVE